MHLLHTGQGADPNWELGKGMFYTGTNGGPSVPVNVVSMSGTGTVGGVASLRSNDDDAVCALLISGLVDCWGYGWYGELRGSRDC